PSTTISFLTSRRVVVTYASLTSVVCLSGLVFLSICCTILRSVTVIITQHLSSTFLPPPLIQPIGSGLIGTANPRSKVELSTRPSFSPSLTPLLAALGVRYHTSGIFLIVRRLLFWVHIYPFSFRLMGR